MSKRFQRVNTGRALRRGAWQVAGLGLLSCGIIAPFAVGDEQPSATGEGSVLIAVRDAASESAGLSPSGNPSGLEPLSQVAERSPDLADSAQPAKGWQSNSRYTSERVAAATQTASATQPAASPAADESSQFGAALAGVVRSQKAAPTLQPGKIQAGAANAVGNPILVQHEPARFNRVQPGTTSKSQLTAAWGEPSSTEEADEGLVLIYDIEPFQGVDVLIGQNDVVKALKITLAGGLDPQQLAEQLALLEFEPVTITDGDERPLGIAFPERGVVFMFDPTAPTTTAEKAAVAQVAIQALDARAFALRAENQLYGPYEKNIRDLKTATAIDPRFTHARWLLAEIYLSTGQADLAEAEAAAALEVEPDNAALQVRHGQALYLLGNYDDAVLKVRGVLDRVDTSPVVRAQAMHEMARLAAIGDAEIASKAISFDTRAIELADQLAASENIKERRAAKRLLVEAHLAVAEEISRQSFAGKVDSLQQWVGRASGIAEDYIANEGGSVELRLIVAQRALAALASFKPTLDPAPWVAEAEEAAAALRKQSDDAQWQQQISWEIGQVYLHALRTDHLRRETATALKYGQKAIENLAEGAASRQAVHSAEQNVGQLYFHIGAVYAVHQQDHKKAVAWYEKAAPLLAGDRPQSELYSPRRDGEMLVSMGVSYWQTGNQNRALELTEAGAKLVEQAVEDGILAKSSLAVPYGNLATMYQNVGETSNAVKYANMAKALSASTTPPAPQRGRATAQQVTNGRTGMIQTGGQQPARSAARR